MRELIYFILGLSLMLNFILIFVFMKIKDKFEIDKGVVNVDDFKEFEKEDKKSWNSFFSNDK